MSPDERSVERRFEAAVRRVRAMAVAEAIGWGAAAAAVTLPALPIVVLLVLVWRLRSATPVAVVRRIDRGHSNARNVFVTADELRRGILDAKPDARQRVFARAAEELKAVDLRVAAPLGPPVRAIAIAAAAWAVVAASTVWPVFGRAVRQVASTAASRSGAAGVNAIHVTVALAPPAYTGGAATSATDPLQIRAVEGTQASVVISAPDAKVTVEHDGSTRTLTRDASGQFVERIALQKNGYYAVSAEPGGRRVIPLVVSPDALPSVVVTAPGKDLVFPAGDRRIAFSVRATDDFGLRALTLEYTKVSGSGEQFSFEEGEIPLTLTKTSPRNWSGAGAQSLANLKLDEGDMLVYRAVAADGRPGDGSARSDAFFIEVSKLAAAAGDAFTVPEEETRYALSQQMLIIKTERLDRQRASLAPAEFADAALNLAVEQRMIRAEFVFMLGGEIQDEDVEAEQSSELQEGRLQNRGQRDLRAATVAMSQAEKFLTGAVTHDALTAERAAVAALQKAFARDRYILRALGSRTELDLKRRLTGSLAGAAGGRRDRLTAAPNRRAAVLQDLIAGIGRLRVDASNASTSAAVASAEATTLAREALRIDAGSTVLQKAAADLQQVADSWGAAAAGARNASLEAIAAAVAAEAGRALSPATVSAPFVSPDLAGGFVDTLRRGVSK